ncbi:hypothetical protein SAMN05428988_1319 [Chitinophaga sp. YR573]|uniref:hypothetical protein n=1 Tax=Chitinophaga sp. YR573 TaxID=1881040 RepID=UPI0008D0B07F|nr:hypothetical protein [Chitinophaga sp. YR573]SEW01993.1 hypothetical protein SAMN05428988_1319 [Chitinophaga sp. YR573]
MKTILIALCATMAISINSYAQAPKSERLLLSSTLTNAATVNLSFNGIGSGLKTIQVAALKVSGTVAGSAYIQATVDGVNWLSVTDTLTLTNVTTNTKVWTFTATNYNSYRAVFTGSGSMAATITAALLRRADEYFRY